MLRNITRHVLLRSVPPSNTILTARYALRGVLQSSINTTLPSATTLGSFSPLSPLSTLGPTITTRNFASSTHTKGQGAEESTDDDDPLRHNQQAGKRTGEQEAKEGEQVLRRRWIKYQQREKIKKNVISYGSALFVYCIGGLGIVVLVKEVWNLLFQFTATPRWIPNILIQHLLLEIIPTILNNKEIIAQYGPLAVHESSISFQQFGTDKMTVTFLIYQQIRGARVGTVFIDLEKGEDDHMRVKNAYICYALGGPPLALELNPAKYDFDLQDPNFGEEGAYKLMMQQREEELRREKEFKEMEARERERMAGGPLRGLIR